MWAGQTCREHAACQACTASCRSCTGLGPAFGPPAWGRPGCCNSRLFAWPLQHHKLGILPLVLELAARAMVCRLASCLPRAPPAPQLCGSPSHAFLSTEHVPERSQPQHPGGWHRCRRLAALPKPSLLQPLGPVLPLLGMLLCWGQAVWNLLLGAAIMVLVIKFAVRAQLLTSSGAQKPITSIFLGLGLACGAAG